MKLSLINKLFQCFIFINWTLANDEITDYLHSTVPPPLTLANFDDTLKSGFHVVEFFSPYCPHCNHLFPTWVDFYVQNQPFDVEIDPRTPGQNGEFGIHQVDCVASGDLCDREGIYYYPMIRFYGPGSQLLGSMTETHRTVDTLNAFVDDQIMAWADDFSELDMSSNKFDVTNDGKNIEIFHDNKMLDSSEMIKIINGDIDTPRLVSFWPTSDNDLNDKTFLHTFKQNQIFKNYEHLFQFRNIWNLLMKHFRSYINDGTLHFNYFNCKSNKELCLSLGFDNFNNGIDEDLTPNIALYLPKSTGGNAIYYKNELSRFQHFNSMVKSLSQWVTSTLINSEMNNMKFNDIINFVDTKTKLNGKGGISDFPDFSKVAFVQVNDPSTEVPEDDLLFEHLLQPIAELNSNVYLFKTNDKDEVLKFLEEQEKTTADKYIHFKDTSARDKSLKFDESLFLSRTRSTFPMLICLKSNSMYSPVYQSFMSKDIRDIDEVTKFIHRNYLPIINHFNLETKDTIFPKKLLKGIHHKTEKVMISITDFQPKQFFDVEFFMSFVYHKFTYLNNKFRRGKIEKLREKKQEKVRKIKENNGSSDDIIEALRDIIDVPYTTSEDYVYPVYLDIKKFPYMVSKMGWNNIDAKKYKVGDSLIIERFSNNYWDHDINGNQLTIENPNQCVETLEKISFDDFKGKKIYETSFILKTFQVLLFILVGLIIAKIFKRWRNNRAHAFEKMKGLGILGVPSPDDSKCD